MMSWMMTIKKISLFFLVLSVMSCGRYNSEFAAPNFNGIAILKPTCAFKPSQTCWKADLEKLSACGEDSKSEALDFFDDDYRSCENYRDKKMNFFEPTIDYLRTWESGSFAGFMAFNMLSRGKTCFSFEGTEKDFTIESEEFGQLAYRELTSGEVQVKCFSGEILKISPEVAQSGCSNSSLPANAFLPRVELRGNAKGEEKNLSLKFFGTGTKDPFSLFQCH